MKLLLLLKHCFLFICLLFFTFHTDCFAQEKYSVSGYVKDAESKETLIGSTVYAPYLQTGTVTNDFGYYTLSLPQDTLTLLYSFVGYTTQVIKLDLQKDETLDIELGIGELLEAVEVVADSYRDKIRSTQMSVENVTVKEAKMLPALFGEVDIIKTLQLKPGIQSGNEGSSGLYVRGGGPDQNLVLLDDAVVYNPDHLFGFFSTFNPDAVKNVQLYKGGFPAEYGGKLSSVIDVNLREGNRNKIAGSGGIGLISSRLTLDGPLNNGKGSFLVSGRRTYVDAITSQINAASSNNQDFNPIPDYFFYDFNAKASYDLGDKDKIFLSGYLGKDAFSFDDDFFDFTFNWGNTLGSLRWSHIFNGNMFLNVTANYTSYDYTIANQFDIFSFELGSAIRDWSGKADFYYTPNNDHDIKFGASAINHKFEIGRLNAGAADSSFVFRSGIDLFGNEYGAYISDDWEATPALKLNMGLRVSAFNFNDQWYGGLEPRFAAKLSLSENASVKASYSRMFQYIHLVSNSGATLPTDLWYPSTTVVQPQIADQVAAGVSLNLGEQFLLSNEFYYKWYQNQIDFRDGAELFANENLDPEFVFGTGYSYGNEVYLEKKQGKTTGWIGYTYSWSWREFDDINNGERYHPRYDRRHDASVVLMHELSDRVTLTGAWVYGTGNAVSLPYGRAFRQDAPGVGTDLFSAQIPIYTERNGYRMPSYHRLDVGAVIETFKKWKRLKSSNLTVSVYNTYDRRNPFVIFYEPFDEDGDDIIDRFRAQQISLFPVLPSFTWNFEF